MNTFKQKNKYQILLCGTQYGQSYLPAIFESEQLELAAILTKGSRHSGNLADQTGAERFTQVSDINIDIDGACVAIGGKNGVKVASELLQRRIPVLIEHPVSGQAFDELHDIALKNNTVIQVNGHFSYLPDVTDFIHLSKQLNLCSRPLVVQTTCNSRTLFSLLDILQRIFNHVDFSHAPAPLLPNSQEYVQINVDLDMSPGLILYQAWRKAIDDSTDSPLGHHITITYPQGVLSLCGTFGPCLWHPLISAAVPRNVPLCSTLNNNFQDKHNPLCVENIIEWRKVANARAIDELMAVANEISAPPDYQHAAFLSRLCHSWSSLTQLIPHQIRDYTEAKLDEKFWLAETILSTH